MARNNAKPLSPAGLCQHDERVTLHGGYALHRDEALEDLDMGGGSVLSLKVTGEESNGGVTVIGGVVRAGGPPLHMHDAEDEVVICMAGRLTYQVGDDRGELAPGSLVWFPRQVPHAVANLASEPCHFFTVVTPSGIEDLFRAQRDYLRGVGPESPFEAAVFETLPGSGTRHVMGPPLS